MEAKTKATQDKPYWSGTTYRLSDKIRYYNSTTEDDRLADAAPDLLAACEAVKRFLDTYHDAGELHTQLRAAIAKAKGGAA